jgi:hypothetical protein
MKISEQRRKIILDAAAWCAFSSTRSGCPIKSRKDIYPLLDEVDFDKILDDRKGIITKGKFNAWHKTECLKLACKLEKTKNLKSNSMIGWAAKIINVYLKIACYIGELGREGLVQHIHPPLDGGLARGVKRHVVFTIPTIKSIKSYESYREIIQEIEKHTTSNGWFLIEIEKYWIFK